METVALAYDVYETPETQKDKCPIIFLHGLFWNKYMLKDLAESMCHLTKRKVYCLDIRCHDQSPFREHFTVEIIAEDILRFIKDRQLEKVAFVCHSFSATCAYLALLKEPDVVEKLVMIDHPPFADYSMEAFYEEVYPQFVAQTKLLEILDPSMTLSTAKRKLRHLSEEAKSEGKKIFLQKAAYELIKVNKQFTWKTDHRFLIEKSKQSAETIKTRGRSDHEILIIRSKDSPLVSNKKFEAVLKYNPNATVKTIDDASHLLMFEKPEEFLEAVKEVLL